VAEATLDKRQPLALCFREYRRNLEGHLQRSRTVQRAFEKDHGVVYNLATILEIEKNYVYRKYKEAAHMSCSKDPITLPTGEILPICFPLFSEKLGGYTFYTEDSLSLT
jgi:hypothetical protein